MKKFLVVIPLILIAALLLPLSSCSSYGPAPELEDVYDRVVEVVEASHEVNVLLFGAGLPVYPRGDAEDTLVHRYYGVTDNGQEFVKPYAKFATTVAMKTAIEQVYSVEYREALYENLFTGYADAELGVTVPARYAEDDKALYQSVHIDPLVVGTRVYDYAGMTIDKGSNGKYIRVSIPSYSEQYPDEWTTVHLTFVYENGNWYLDSPSC